MQKYVRKAVEAELIGDKYKVTDGMGTVSFVEKDQFEALFEPVEDIVVTDSDMKSVNTEGEKIGRRGKKTLT